MNLILAIDTSCDETSAAVTDGRKVLSNVISSQIDLHKKYGGVFPSLAKRAHEERIDYVIKEALRRASAIIASKQYCHCEEPTDSAGDKAIPNKERDCFGDKPLAMTTNRFQISNFKFQIDAIAVTQGPGLAIALEVGIRKAKEIIKNFQFSIFNFQLPLIAVNHLEGHIYSCWAETNVRCEDRSKKLDKEARNKKQCHSGLDPESICVDSRFRGNDKLQPPTSTSNFPLHTSHILFPALCLIVSGGHTQLVLMKDHGIYETIGATLDDACGEALDKAAKILKLGYPGGPIIEKLTENVGVDPRVDPSKNVVQNNGRTHRSAPTRLFKFNQPLPQKNNLNFSYSGLKTQLLYLVQSLAEKDFNASLKKLAFSFQEACFEQIIRKASNGIKKYQPKSLVCGGGVIANKYLRKLLRNLAKQNSLPIYFPQNKKLITDNAAMIGVAAYFKMLRGEFVEDPETLDREPRLALS